MSRHVFHEIYLHLNWHVKNDRPTLTDDVETLTHRLITDRCRRITGVYLHALNGTATHVHLAVNIEPHVYHSSHNRPSSAAAARSSR